VKPGQKVFWGGHSGYFADPDGYLRDVAHNPLFWVGPKDEDAYQGHGADAHTSRS
jgi:uncharacterized protein